MEKKVMAVVRALLMDDNGELGRDLRTYLEAAGVLVSNGREGWPGANGRGDWDVIFCCVNCLVSPGGEEWSEGTDGVGGQLHRPARYDPGLSDCLLVGVGSAQARRLVLERLGRQLFDYIEHPMDRRIVPFQVRRLVCEAQLCRSIRSGRKRLELHLQDLKRHRDMVKELHDQLLRANRALSVLAQNLEQEKIETEKRIMFGFRRRILPLMDRLRRCRGMRRHIEALERIFEPVLENLPPPLPQGCRLMSELTYTESRIATMIAEGLDTKAISEELGTSASTIRTHRRNIRKKLKINGAHYNLKYFLRAKCPEIGRQKATQMRD